jgi:hypothetical protein
VAGALARGGDRLQAQGSPAGAGALRNDRSGARGPIRVYHTALIAQVRGGKIEMAKLDPLLAAIDKAQQAKKDRDAELLDGLHAALEPAQHMAVVAAVRARQAEHPHRAAEPETPKQRLDQLTRDLALDPAQRKRVEALLAKDAPPPADEGKKRTDALLAAFEGEGFNAKKLDFGPLPAKIGLGHDAQLFSGLVPLLKPDQREKLAAGLEKSHTPRPAARTPGGDHPSEGPAPEPPGPTAP